MKIPKPSLWDSQKINANAGICFQTTELHKILQKFCKSVFYVVYELTGIVIENRLNKGLVKDYQQLVVQWQTFAPLFQIHSIYLPRVCYKFGKKLSSTKFLNQNEHLANQAEGWQTP